MGQGEELVSVDEALAEGDLLDAGDLEALAAFHDMDELRGLEQGVVGARIEPGEAAAEPLDMELARLHVVAVDIGDLELAAGRGLDRRGDIDHVRPVEIEPGRRPVRLRRLGLFLDRNRALLLVELDDAVALGIVDPIGEDGGAARELAGLLQDLAETMAEEEIVAEHERRRLPAQEIAADDEGLGQALGPRLLGKGDIEAPLPSVAQRLAIALDVAGGGDHQHLADAGQHQRRERVIDHRLVVDRQQLLADGIGHRIEPGARTSRQYDALHAVLVPRAAISFRQRARLSRQGRAVTP